MMYFLWAKGQIFVNKKPETLWLFLSIYVTYINTIGTIELVYNHFSLVITAPSFISAVSYMWACDGADVTVTYSVWTMGHIQDGYQLEASTPMTLTHHKLKGENL